MTPALPVVSGAAAVKALEKAGFDQVSQRGSHVKLRSREGRTVIVPMHRELARGTLLSILRQARLSIGEFSALLRRAACSVAACGSRLVGSSNAARTG